MIKHQEASDPTSCWNKAHHDERVFVLLGRDQSAPAAIRAWAHDRINRRMNDVGDALIFEALVFAASIEADLRARRLLGDV